MYRIGLSIARRVLGLAFLVCMSGVLSCSLGTPGPVSVDLSGLVSKLALENGDLIGSVDLTLTSAQGEILLAASVDPLDAKSVSVALDPGETYELGVDVGLRSMAGGSIDRHWTTTESITAKPGRMEVTVSITRAQLPATLSVIYDSSGTLAAALTGSATSGVSLSYSSDNSSVLSVNSDTGDYTAMGLGTAVVTATPSDGGIPASCAVTVSNGITVSISLSTPGDPSITFCDSGGTALDSSSAVVSGGLGMDIVADSGFSSYTWLVNGTEVAADTGTYSEGNGLYVNGNTAGVVMGTNNLTLIVNADGTYYSASFTFYNYTYVAGGY